MKNTLFKLPGLCASILLIFSACVSSQSFIPVKGSGMAVEKSFNVSGFTGIEVSGGFDVILSQGESESVTLQAQENLYKYIHVEVEQGILRIYTENNLWPTEPLKAKIMFSDITRLHVSGGGDVKAENRIKAEGLEIALSGGGDITADVDVTELNCSISGGGDARLNGSANKFDINMTGGGDLESTMNAGTLFCRLSGGGDLKLRSEIEATEIKFELSGGGDADAVLNTSDLTCTLSGGGNASLSGKASHLDLNLNGGGDIHASELKVTTADFDVSGGSDLHLNVSEEIKGNISGGGDVYYSGSPEVVTIDARGGSEVHRQ